MWTKQCTKLIERNYLETKLKNKENKEKNKKSTMIKLENQITQKG
jgi:hypothetical protein